MSAKTPSERNNEKQARIQRLQAALNIARGALKEIATEGSGRTKAAEALDKIEARMMKR